MATRATRPDLVEARSRALAKRDQISWWYLSGYLDIVRPGQVAWPDTGQCDHWRDAFEMGRADAAGELASATHF